MKAEIGKEIIYLTWRFIMAFLGDWTRSAERFAGEGTRNTTFGNYCKIFSSSAFRGARDLGGAGALTRD